MAFDSTATGVWTFTDGDRRVAARAASAREASPSFAVLYLVSCGNFTGLSSTSVAYVLESTNLAGDASGIGTPSNWWQSCLAPGRFNLRGGDFRVQWWTAFSVSGDL